MAVEPKKKTIKAQNLHDRPNKNRKKYSQYILNVVYLAEHERIS